jgi:carbamate kinase
VCAAAAASHRGDAGGGYVGIEAVIDKDFAGPARDLLHADAFLMLTDVDAAYADWGTPDARPIRRASPDDLAGLAFAAGSMGPKVEAACRFVRANSGFAVIGSLADAGAMLRGEAGTLVAKDTAQLEWGSAKLAVVAAG